jgi:uncharacterized membrane protein YgdD (TMEM256/DUF423 family)
MHRPFLAIGCLFGFIGVAAGAFGAHGLEGTIPVERLATFETGVRYQLVHALALIMLGLLAARWPTRAWAGPGILFTAGTLIFAGSLYALAFTGIGVFGAIAPIGGTSLLAGWLWMTLVVLRDS